MCMGFNLWDISTHKFFIPGHIIFTWYYGRTSVVSPHPQTSDHVSRVGSYCFFLGRIFPTTKFRLVIGVRGVSVLSAYLMVRLKFYAS